MFFSYLKTTELMQAIKTLNFAKVSELLAKMQATPTTNGNKNDKTQQVALLNTAINTGSLEMIELILKNNNNNTNDSPDKSEETPSQEANGANTTNETKPPKFLEKEYNALKKLLTLPAPKINTESKQEKQQQQQQQQNTTTEQNPDDSTTTTTTSDPLDSIPWDTEDSSESTVEGKEATQQQQQQQQPPLATCPEGLDENFYINRNRRHARCYDEENPEDVNKFEWNKQSAHLEEMSKNERLIKTMGAKKKRKHSVAKHL